MVSKDLLNTKKEKNHKNLLSSKRIATPVPSKTYNEESTDIVRKKEPSKKKTTTARVSFDVLNRAKALINMGLFSSFDDLVHNLLSNYEERGLSEKERHNQQLMIETYEVQQKFNNKSK